jgi:hypothetical protein
MRWLSNISGPPARRLLLVQHGAESKMAVPAFAPVKELAVLGHSDGEVASASRHRPRLKGMLAQ